MDIKEVIYGRRSIREYETTPVRRDTIEEIIEGACMAPSAANQQPWYFLAITSEAQRNKCIKYVDKSFAEYQGALIKRFGKDSPVVEETAAFFKTLGGAPVVVLAFLLKNDYSDPIMSIMSSAAAIQNLLLMAYGKGLASCWLTVPSNAQAAEQLRAEFAPDKGRLLGVITLGYSSRASAAPSRRNNRFEII